MDGILDIGRIMTTNVEYIQKILYEYYIEYLTDKKSKDKYYFYNNTHNVDFNDKQIYWYLSQMGIITIKCQNQKQAALLDIAMEVLFMQKDSHFKYYLDYYFDDVLKNHSFAYIPGIHLLVSDFWNWEFYQFLQLLL